jgi:signal transduction histidine kinase
MKSRTWDKQVADRNYWLVYMTGFLLIAVALIRISSFTYRYYSPFHGLMPVLFLLLYIPQPFLVRRFSWFKYAYFSLQILFVELAGLDLPYEDIWCLFYIALSLQVLYAFSGKRTWIWWGLIGASICLTLIYTLGLLAGFGRGLFFIAVIVFVISFNIAFLESETARRQSQEYLAQLKEAHENLKKAASRMEEIAAEQERNRMANELHDSVGQIIFSITLTARSMHLALEKDPQRVPEMLEQLQELTGGALSKMRALISQWRGG